MAGKRPTLDEPTRKAILDALGAGVPLTHAAQAATIGRATIYDWVARGEREHDELQELRDDLTAVKGRTKTATATRKRLRIRIATLEASPFPDLPDAIAQARARAVAGNVARVIQAAGKDWRAAAWWLERQYPDDFAQRQKLDVGGQPDNPVQSEERLELAAGDDEAVNDAAREYLKALGQKERRPRLRSVE